MDYPQFQLVDVFWCHATGQMAPIPLCHHTASQPVREASVVIISLQWCKRAVNPTGRKRSEWEGNQLQLLNQLKINIAGPVLSTGWYGKGAPFDHISSIKLRWANQTKCVFNQWPIFIAINIICKVLDWHLIVGLFNLFWKKNCFLKNKFNNMAKYYSPFTLTEREGTLNFQATSAPAKTFLMWGGNKWVALP